VKRRLELQPEMNNVLALDTPQEYRCRVVGYLLDRSLMVVEVINKKQLFYVVFPDVHYYDGTFLWQGATLRTASRDEQFNYMLDKSIVAALGMLYVFEGADCTVHLLSGDWIAIFDELPDRFK
jgi:hypothetical protein